MVFATALWWFASHGFLLFHGDAAAHLNIARRIFDSLTPHYDQIGTVWLPIPHLAMMALAGDPELWRTGLAGGIPAAIANALGAAFLFAYARRLLGSAAGWTALGAFLLNPNVLYLGSIPMTEPFFFFTLFATLYFALRSAETGSVRWAAVAGLSALGATLVRYDGWFLLPFFTVWLAARNVVAGAVFALIASAGPAYWALHNLYLDGDPLGFYRGPYSSIAINERTRSRTMPTYPGEHDWLTATRYLAAAARLVADWGLVTVGLLGVVLLCIRRTWGGLIIPAVLPLFYVWSVHSSGLPIFVPHLWPNTYYNIRYGLALFPLFVIGAAAVAARLPSRWWSPIPVLALATAPWIWKNEPENWILWKEAQVNSESRRAWTAEVAAVLKANYRGGGIFTTLGDSAAVFEQAGIPLRETVNECNFPHFAAAIARPELFLREEWAVAVEGDPVDTAIAKAMRKGPRYRCERTIAVKGAPVIRIYRFDSRAGLAAPTEEEIEQSRREWDEREER
jgi:hypothetical protein